MPINGSVSEDSVDRAGESDADDVDDRHPATKNPSNSTPKRRRRRLPLAIIGVVVVAAVAVTAVVLSSGSSPKAPSNTAPKPPATFTTFNDSAAGFAVSYPQTWAVVKSGDPGVPLLLNIGLQGLNTLLVRVVTLQTSVDTSSVANMKAFTDSVISGTNVTVLQQQSINVHGVPGYYYFYTLPKDPTTGVTLVHSHFFVFPPHEMVSLTFQTVDHDFAGLAPTFDQVVNSIRIVPSP